jgi:hypothetical protein
MAVARVRLRCGGVFAIGHTHASGALIAAAIVQPAASPAARIKKLWEKIPLKCGKFKARQTQLGEDQFDHRE